CADITALPILSLGGARSGKYLAARCRTGPILVHFDRPVHVGVFFSGLYLVLIDSVDGTGSKIHRSRQTYIKGARQVKHSMRLLKGDRPGVKGSLCSVGPERDVKGIVNIVFKLIAAGLDIQIVIPFRKHTSQTKGSGVING